MNRLFAATAAIPVLALAVGLSGCQKSASAAAPLASAATYCAPFKTAQVSYPTADPAAAFEDCTHRWGYALAQGRDSADVVAQAVVDACATPLSQWNQQTLSQNPQGDTAATSLVTGQPTDLGGERARYAQSRALFYVVQARAGHCSAPPPTLLASAG